MCIDFYDLSSWCGCWFVVYIYKEVYLQIFKCVSFWLHGCCGELEGGPVNQVNHTSWVAVVTPTVRPKVNCCLIELFCGVVCVVTLPFLHFCWCRGFCHRTGSDLLLFVSFLYVTFGCTTIAGSLTIGTFLFILKPLNAFHRLYTNVTIDFPRYFIYFQFSECGSRFLYLRLFNLSTSLCLIMPEISKCCIKP